MMSVITKKLYPIQC